MFTRTSGVGGELVVSKNASSTDPGASQKKLHQSRREDHPKILEYCKVLGIDPVKDADIVWIAEEAYQAPLPTGWSEHDDHKGNKYFHDHATGLSHWEHPLDRLFRDVIRYYRDIMRLGGFWTVEDDLAQKEAAIRDEVMNDWMELYDVDGNAYYYNRKTDKSMWDDPRRVLYQDLYTRIKLVSKLKERYPLLARAPRPDEPTPLQQRSLDEEEKAQVRNYCAAVSLQGFARIISAKNEAHRRRERRDMCRGFQPLKSRVHLRLDKLPTGRKDLVLSHTAGHRRYAAARRIQACLRGMLVRKRMRPVILHRKYQRDAAIVIQRKIRRYLNKIRSKRRKERAFVKAYMTIQVVWRAYKARKYVKILLQQKRAFDDILKKVIKIQTQFRMKVARKEVYLRRMRAYVPPTRLLQRQIRVHQARIELFRYLPRFEPITSLFVPNTDPKTMGVLPWSWKVLVTPTDANGVLQRRGRMYLDLFSKSSEENFKTIAAVCIQRFAKGWLTRRKLARRRLMAREELDRVLREEEDKLRIRNEAATKIQKIARGWSNRHNNVVGKQRKIWLRRRALNVMKMVSYANRFSAMSLFRRDVKNHIDTKAAIRIQKHWRAFVARRQFEVLQMECLWPVRGCFDYVPTGPNSAYCTVQFVPNSAFDDEQFFLKFVDCEELRERIAAMNFAVDAAVQSYLDSVAEPEQPPDEPKSAPDEPDEPKPKEEDPSQKLALLWGLIGKLGTASNSTDPVARWALISDLLADTAAKELGSIPLSELLELMERKGLVEFNDDHTLVAFKEFEKVISVCEVGVDTQEDDKVQLDTNVITPILAPEVVDAEVQAEVRDESQEAKYQLMLEQARAAVLAEEKAKRDAKREAQRRAQEEAQRLKALELERLRFEEERRDAQRQHAEEEAKRAEEEAAARHAEKLLRDQGRSLRVLAEAEREFELASPLVLHKEDPKGRRKTYAGIFADGKFERTKAQKLDDLSKDEKQQLLDDMEEERRRKEEEFARKNRLEKAKRKKIKKHLKSSASCPEIKRDDARKTEELGGWLKQKDSDERTRRSTDIEAMRRALEQAHRLHSNQVAAQRLASDPAARQRELLQIAEGRRDHILQVMVQQAEANPQAQQKTQEAFARSLDTSLLPPAPGRLLHRHVHHHMHYHNPQEDNIFDNPSDFNETLPTSEIRLPRLVAPSDSLSDGGSGWTVGPQRTSFGFPASRRSSSESSIGQGAPRYAVGSKSGLVMPAIASAGSLNNG